jgi:hypothetical protein
MATWTVLGDNMELFWAVLSHQLVAAPFGIGPRRGRHLRLAGEHARSRARDGL